MKREMINIGLQRYGTRMLQVGDSFEANRRDARVLNALKKASYASDAEPSALGEGDDPAVELADLRHEYKEKLGKRPFNGWKADELREKIAAGLSGES